MHNFPRSRVTPAPAFSQRPHLSATHVVRGAMKSDAAEIHELVSGFAEAGLLLPRSADDIALTIDDYVVVADQHGRVMGCAALHEYSPSLGEVGSVVVAPEAQGRGLGSIAVRGVEGIARRRGIEELFAVTLADHFFDALGYARCALARYPEKLARYATMARLGVPIVPKSCYRKMASWP
ncbi:MAG: GNAT family N-acetyltransferase [Gemmatimonadota bacterium]